MAQPRLSRTLATQPMFDKLAKQYAERPVEQSKQESEKSLTHLDSPFLSRLWTSAELRSARVCESASAATSKSGSVKRRG